jgi:hypothetical protein
LNISSKAANFAARSEFSNAKILSARAGTVMVKGGIQTAEAESIYLFFPPYLLVFGSLPPLFTGEQNSSGDLLVFDGDGEPFAPSFDRTSIVRCYGKIISSSMTVDVPKSDT